MWLSCTSYGIKMSSDSVLNYAEDGRRETGWPPRGHYRGLVNVFVLPSGAVGKRTAQMHTPEIFRSRLSLSNICAIIMLYMTVRRVKPEQSGGRVKIQTAKCHSEGTKFVVSWGAGSPVAAVDVSTDS